MAKKFVFDPEKKKRMEEEYLRLQGVAIPSATPEQEAAINTRAGQVIRPPREDQPLPPTLPAISAESAPETESSATAAPAIPLAVEPEPPITTAQKPATPRKPKVRAPSEPNSRSRGRPRVNPVDAQSVNVRMPPTLAQKLIDDEDGAGRASLRLIYIALDLIDAAGGEVHVGKSVELIRAVRTAANKNVAAQAARETYKQF